MTHPPQQSRNLGRALRKVKYWFLSWRSLSHLMSNRSGHRARNLSEEEESTSSQESEDEKKDDSDDDEEDNFVDEEHEDEVDNEEGDNIAENVTQDQEEDEDDDDDNDNDNYGIDDDEDGNEIGKQISEDEHNSRYANTENDLQTVVASNGNAKEVTKPDIAEDIDKQNEHIKDLDIDEDAQVEEERFEGAQFEEVLVQVNTNEKKDYDDGDDQQLDIERTVTDDVAGAPREELTQLTTSKAIYEYNKDGEGDNVCMARYKAQIEEQDNKTEGVGEDKKDGEEDNASMVGYEAEIDDQDSKTQGVEEEKKDDIGEEEKKGEGEEVDNKANIRDEYKTHWDEEDNMATSEQLHLS
ncbi:hypothetical protein V2J09_006153 [Rumex salicifolius]